VELDQVMNELNRHYRREVVTRGLPLQTRTLPTGLANLDLALGGGMVLGKQCGIVGHEGSGKTTLALSIAREAQARGYWVIWADCERSLDYSWARQVGVDVEDQFGVMVGLTGEDAFKTVRDILLALRNDNVESRALVVVDSIAAMVPEDDFENTTTVAPGARLVNRAIRVWNALQPPTVGLVLINQYRSSPSSMRPVLPHGMGQLFHLSQRVDMRGGQWIKEKDTVIGKEIKWRIEKNKVGSPYGMGVLDLYFDHPGCFDRTKALAIAAIEAGVVDQAGSWYTFSDGTKAQGLSNLTQLLESTDRYTETLGDMEALYRNKPVEYSHDEH
jgi:recombination protein RecA